jgi:hypothetical protein
MTGDTEAIAQCESVITRCTIILLVAITFVTGNVTNDYFLHAILGIILISPSRLASTLSCNSESILSTMHAIESGGTGTLHTFVIADSSPDAAILASPSIITFAV